MDQDHKSGLCGKIKNSVESRVLKTGGFSRDLRGHELLVNRELSDSREHTGKCLEHAPDVVRRVHVCGIEACNHGVKAGLLLFVERLIRHSDPCVGERVVIDRSIRI